MIVAMPKPLFAWDCLEDSPSLGTIKKFLASVPDGKLLEGLRQSSRSGTQRLPGACCLGRALAADGAAAYHRRVDAGGTRTQRRAPPTHRHRDGRRCSGLLEHLPL